MVTRDEREQGERRKLNFGHTFGHAIEKLTGIPHGEAVGIGMVLAATLSVQKGLLPPTDAQAPRTDRRKLRAARSATGGRPIHACGDAQG